MRIHQITILFSYQKPGCSQSLIAANTLLHPRLIHKKNGEAGIMWDSLNIFFIDYDRLKFVCERLRFIPFFDSPNIAFFTVEGKSWCERHGVTLESRQKCPGSRVTPHQHKLYLSPSIVSKSAVRGQHENVVEKIEKEIFAELPK